MSDTAISGLQQDERMGPPATKKPTRDRENLSLDYRSDKPLPDWVREVIDTVLSQ